MEILYLGHSCFLFRHKKNRVVCDPFGESTGFKQKKVWVDIVTISHDHFDHNDLSLVKGDYKLVNGPGEYEINKTSITGIQSFHDDKRGEERGKNTIYVFDMAEFRICHLGDLGHQLNEKQLEKLDGVDILLVPVGGHFTIDPKQAKEVIAKIGALIVIPMHYKTKEHDKGFDKLKTVKEFVKEMEVDPKRKNKLKIKKQDLPEEMEVVVLNRYGKG